jgi:hypothetical protein
MPSQSIGLIKSTVPIVFRDQLTERAAPMAQLLFACDTIAYLKPHFYFTIRSPLHYHIIVRLLLYHHYYHIRRNRSV